MFMLVLTWLHCVQQIYIKPGKDCTGIQHNLSWFKHICFLFLKTKTRDILSCCIKCCIKEDVSTNQQYSTLVFWRHFNIYFDFVSPSVSFSHQKKLFCTAESSSETLRQKKVGKWTPVWPAEAWRSAICHHAWVAAAATFRTYASKPWVSGLKESRRKPAEVPPQGWGPKPGGSAEEELTAIFAISFL